VQDIITFGTILVLENKAELSLAYMHAFENIVNGSGSVPPGSSPSGFGGGKSNLKMYQDSLGVAYGWKL
jgi:long-chain fatty acid transport protein